MNDYEAIGVYAAFALAVFSIAMIWRANKDALKKRFHLLNYRPTDSDTKAPHARVT